jgi:hypothetical protein
MKYLMQKKYNFFEILCIIESAFPVRHGESHVLHPAVTITGSGNMNFKCTICWQVQQNS